MTMDMRAEGSSEDIHQSGGRFSLCSLSNNILLLLSDDDDDDDDDNGVEEEEDNEDEFIEISLEPQPRSLYVDEEEEKQEGKNSGVYDNDAEEFKLCSLNKMHPFHSFSGSKSSTLTLNTATSSAAGQQLISPSINSNYRRKMIPVDRLITTFITFKGLSSKVVDNSSSSRPQLPLVNLKFLKSIWSMLLADSSSKSKQFKDTIAIGQHKVTSDNRCYQKKWFRISNSSRRWWLLPKRGNLNATSNKVGTPASFPFHGSKFYSRDNSVQAAIAHCKRSFGQINSSL